MSKHFCKIITSLCYKLHNRRDSQQPLEHKLETDLSRSTELGCLNWHLELAGDHVWKDKFSKAVDTTSCKLLGANFASNLTEIAFLFRFPTQYLFSCTNLKFNDRLFLSTSRQINKTSVGNFQKVLTVQCGLAGCQALGANSIADDSLAVQV